MKEQGSRTKQGVPAVMVAEGGGAGSRQRRVRVELHYPELLPVLPACQGEEGRVTPQAHGEPVQGEGRKEEGKI